MQANVYGGAYNYFDLEGFTEFLKAQDWRAPHSVQLLVKGEEDVKFSLQLTASWHVSLASRVADAG